MLRLNVESTLRLSHAAARAMKARGAGGIITVSSTAAYWSAGTYAASKSWVLDMTRGLRSQMQGSQVRVMALTPGFTRTEFHQRSSTDSSAVKPWLWLDSDEVARVALDDFAAGRGESIPGRQYRALLATVPHLPPGARASLLRRIAPLSSKDQRGS